MAVRAGLRPLDPRSLRLTRHTLEYVSRPLWEVGRRPARHGVHGRGDASICTPVLIGTALTRAGILHEPAAT